MKPQLVLAFFAAVAAAFGDIPEAGTVFDRLELRTGEIITTAKFMSFNSKSATFAMPGALRAIPIDDLPERIRDPLREANYQKQRDISAKQEELNRVQAERQHLEAVQRTFEESVKRIVGRREVNRGQRHWAMEVRVREIGALEVQFCHIPDLQTATAADVKMITVAERDLSSFVAAINKFREWHIQADADGIDTLTKSIGFVGDEEYRFIRGSRQSGLSVGSAIFWTEDVVEVMKFIQMVPEVTAEMKVKLDTLQHAAKLR